MRLNDGGLSFPNIIMASLNAPPKDDLPRRRKECSLLCCYAVLRQRVAQPGPKASLCTLMDTVGLTDRRSAQSHTEIARKLVTRGVGAEQERVGLSLAKFSSSMAKNVQKTWTESHGLGWALIVDE